jgi:hypothetical protein
VARMEARKPAGPADPQCPPGGAIQAHLVGVDAIVSPGFTVNSVDVVDVVDVAMVDRRKGMTCFFIVSGGLARAVVPYPPPPLHPLPLHKAHDYSCRLA